MNRKQIFHKDDGLQNFRKCRKEEAPTGVIAIIVQCTKGVVFN
jgi:hypothetical protein